MRGLNSKGMLFYCKVKVAKLLQGECLPQHTTAKNTEFLFSLYTHAHTQTAICHYI